MRIEGDIDATSILVFVENLFPGLAAVGGAEDAAIRIRAEGMAQCAHEHDVRILGVDNDSADSPAVAQPDILPGFAPIECLVNSVTVRNVAADASLSCAYVNNVGVRWRDGQATDGGSSLLVKHRRPSDSAVGGFPDTTAGRAEIIRCGVAGDARRCERASAAERANSTVLHAFEEGVFI